MRPGDGGFADPRLAAEAADRQKAGCEQWPAFEARLRALGYGPQSDRARILRAQWTDERGPVKALYHWQVDLRAAHEATERLCHFDVDQAGRMYVTEHPGMFGFRSLAEQVCNRARRVNDPSHPLRPLSRAARISPVLTPVAPRARIRSSSSSGVGVRATRVISRRT
jgi:hypothetical protein